MAQALRQAGYRLTRPRLAVLQVLRENQEGLDPQEVHRLGKAICPSLGLVTVYRTLDLLAELGLVRRVHSEQHCHSFASAGRDRHYLLCQGCHRVIEFPALRDGRGVVFCSGRYRVVSEEAWDKLRMADDALRLKLDLEPLGPAPPTDVPKGDQV